MSVVVNQAGLEVWATSSDLDFPGTAKVLQAGFEPWQWNPSVVTVQQVGFEVWAALTSPVLPPQVWIHD
jgi:hypothetical protein